MKNIAGPTVKLDELNIPVFVRTRLDAARLGILRNLYKLGGPGALPPIKVTRKKNLVDGRHRVELARELGWTELPVEWVAEKSKHELIMAAINANGTGSQPLTQADLEYAIEPLVKEGRSRRWIAARLPQFPSEYIGRLYGHVVTKLRRQNDANAVRAIAEGDLTLRQAAARYNVPVSRLREYIDKQNKHEDMDTLLARAKGLNTTHSQKARRVAEQTVTAYKAGHVSFEQLQTVLKTLYPDSIRALQAAHSGWVARAQSLKDGGLEEPLPADFPEAVETGDVE